MNYFLAVDQKKRAQLVRIKVAVFDVVLTQAHISYPESLRCSRR